MLHVHTHTRPHTVYTLVLEPLNKQNVLAMGFNLYNKHTRNREGDRDRDSEHIIDPPSCQISTHTRLPT